MIISSCSSGWLSLDSGHRDPRPGRQTPNPSIRIPRSAGRCLRPQGVILAGGSAARAADGGGTAGHRHWLRGVIQRVITRSARRWWAPVRAIARTARWSRLAIPRAWAPQGRSGVPARAEGDARSAGWAAAACV